MMSSLRRKFCVFIWFLSLLSLLKPSSALCRCEIYHTQELLCEAEFIAQVGVYGHQVKCESPDPRFHGLNKAHIYKILKGKYEDFREGSDISMVTPNGDCAVQPLSGVMLIAGFVLEVGVVILDACSLRAKGLAYTQMMTIQHNIRTRAYNRGCQECNIRKVYDYSYLYPDECRAHYEYPVSTSACLRNPKSGRCEWIRRSGIRHQNTNCHLSLAECRGHINGRPRPTPPPKSLPQTPKWDSIMGTPRRSPPTESSRSPPEEIPVPDGSETRIGVSSSHRVLLHNLRSRLLRIVVNASWPHKL